MITALEKYHNDCYEIMKEADIFPIEIEFDFSMYEQKEYHDDDDDDDDDEPVIIENDQIDSNITSQQEKEDLALFFSED